MDYFLLLPRRTQSAGREVQQKIKKSLDAIKDDNVFARELQIHRQRNIKKANERCEELKKECWTKRNSLPCLSDSQEEDELRMEYNYRICFYIQDQLNITRSIRSTSMDYWRCEVVGDAIFYYIMRGEEPNEHIQKILYRLVFPLKGPFTVSIDYLTWYELCCLMLGEDIVFIQFYERLGNNASGIGYLLFELHEPQLLLNVASGFFMNKLIEHLPYETLHHILTEIRDINGETHMFFLRECNTPYMKLYFHHVRDFYELLSICNSKGQTALHVCTQPIATILANIHTPKHRDELIQLTSMKDKRGRTALDVANDWSRRTLSSLMDQVVNNKYIVDRLSTRILIVCNTKSRPGADVEALTIYNACQSITKSSIKLEKNKCEHEMLDLIRHAAVAADRGLPFKSLVVILLSHGNIGTIHDCNGEPIELAKVEEAMCFGGPEERPKMLITQCSQIGEESGETPPYVPRRDHFCAVLSSRSGQASERRVFLTELSKQIIENRRTQNSIFEIVNATIKTMTDEGHEQTPIIMSTLRAEFFPSDNWHQLRSVDQ